MRSPRCSIVYLICLQQLQVKTNYLNVRYNPIKWKVNINKSDAIRLVYWNYWLKGFYHLTNAQSNSSFCGGPLLSFSPSLSLFISPHPALFIPPVFCRLEFCLSVGARTTLGIFSAMLFASRNMTLHFCFFIFATNNRQHF